MFNINTARLDRGLLMDFASKTLNITKTALNLIIHLTPYIDRDGRIHMDGEKIRREMHCERPVFRNAINELFNTTYNGKKLLTYESGYYVSGFHVSSDGGITYQKNMPILTSSTFLNLNLNEARLFLYILTSNVHNQFKKISIENLYDNKLHDGQSGLRVHDGYKHLADDLLSLHNKKLINIRLQELKLVLEPNNAEHTKAFHESCDFIDDRKKRTSKYNKLKHVIGLKINPDVFKEKSINNTASEAELRAAANRHHMFHEDFKPETIDYIIGRKNTLMDLLGEAGLDIYRDSLERYFGEKGSDVLYYDIQDKAANYFADFYVLEQIKKIVIGALKSALAKKDYISVMGHEGKGYIPKLIEYFVTHSSREHKILIDQDILLIEKAYELMDPTLPSSERHWSDLQVAIDGVYVDFGIEIRAEYYQEASDNGTTAYELPDTLDVKEIIISRAKKSIISNNRELERDTQRMKQHVRFLKLKRSEYEPFGKQEYSEPPEPLHNWLEAAE